MLLLAATATAAALWYAALCAVRPFRRHHRCGGLGRIPVKGGRIRKPCRGWRGCRGDGVKLRLGRRAYAYLKRRRQLGQRRIY